MAIRQWVSLAGISSPGCQRGPGPGGFLIVIHAPADFPKTAPMSRLRRGYDGYPAVHLKQENVKAQQSPPFTVGRSRNT
jgi:hypothetical protein